MKNIFNEADKNEILYRIEKLTPESKAEWGKMDVAQMLAHCVAAIQLPTGEVKTKNSPIQFVGQFFKKSLIHTEKSFSKNAPTSPELKMVDKKEFAKEKASYIAAIKKLHAGGEKSVKAERHPFFGKMTKEEWGILNYKHADHHLRQFGA